MTEQKEALADAIARLPEREKLVVTLYYYEELTLREIGEVLGVTESRVSQLHTKAILRLKAHLAVAGSLDLSLRAPWPPTRPGYDAGRNRQEDMSRMAATEPAKIRNIAVAGHRGVGKTSLVEALLFQAGKTNRLGTVEQGTTVSDWDEHEQKRGDVPLRLALPPRVAGPEDQPRSTRRATPASRPTRSRRCASSRASSSC